MHGSFQDFVGHNTDQDIMTGKVAIPDATCDVEGENLLCAVVALGRLDLLKHLILRGYNPALRTALSSPLGKAITSDLKNSEEMCLVLLQGDGFTIQEDPADYLPELGEPLLHAAAANGKVKVVQKLVESGVSLDWCDADLESGRTRLRDWMIEI